MALIAPSILAADFARLGEALEVIKAAGASLVHVDVMDGHFVPEISAGLPVLASLRKATDLTLDVHLLIERPERYAERFVDAGADRIGIHAEATPHVRRVLEQIRGRGAKAGVAVNPSTPLEALDEVLGEVDFLNVLTAEASLREQPFIPASTAKLRAAAQMRADRRLDFAIQAEGGIGPEKIESLVRAGADILVAGSAIFDSVDPRARLSEMIRVATSVRVTSKV
ncbi:MAG: ribulose-phosphate 3-epimerase [Acidobacteriia bacterium]|nr:ribulose-phosphate 3-epimerase [Terriglobia bacterium]